MQRRWEYANVYWDIEMVDSLVKTIGRDGWELVSTERSDEGIIGFFKRELPDEQEKIDRMVGIYNRLRSVGCPYDIFMHQTNYEVGHPGQEITRQKYVAGVVCVCLLLLLLITYKLFLA